MGQEVITIASIGNGALLELFDDAMRKVIRNVADVNTDPKKPRRINMAVTITPDEDRGVGFATIEVTTKLAGVKPVRQTLYFGEREGEPVAVANNPAQPDMFDAGANNLKITPIRAAK